jgi:hypothetical protein
VGAVLQLHQHMPAPSMFVAHRAPAAVQLLVLLVLHVITLAMVALVPHPG